MSRRASHAAHKLVLPGCRRGSLKRAPTKQADAPDVRAVLELLDDAVFAALGGCDTALAKTRELWPQVVQSLGPDLVDESREQYLRYAIELTRRFEFKEIRNPAVAVAALEIIEMLTRG